MRFFFCYTILMNESLPSTLWKFYTSSVGAWDAMLDECEKATISIDLEQFIFIHDDVGQRFIDVCRRKAKEGVHVRLLCDAAGSFNFYRSTIIDEMKKDGVQIVFFNTFIPWTLHNHSLWFFRDHRKLLIVDGKIGFTGGICLSSEMKDWRDTHVGIQGEVVEEMKQSFTRMWERAHKRKYRAPDIVKIGAQGFNYVTNSPLPRKRFLYHKLINTIRSAKKYVYLTTPYFVPDQRFIRILKLAAHRGIDVRLIVPEHSDHPIVDIGSKSFFHTLIKSGISIYQYKGKMIHSKTVIVDDEWATVGSFNLDNVSFLYNFEANLVSIDKAFVAELKAHFIEDLQHSTFISLSSWIKRSYTAQLLEILVYPIRKFL